jgi:hypothetical protein
MDSPLSVGPTPLILGTGSLGTADYAPVRRSNS